MEHSNKDFKEILDTILDGQRSLLKHETGESKEKLLNHIVDMENIRDKMLAERSESQLVKAKSLSLDEIIAIIDEEDRLLPNQ